MDLKKYLELIDVKKILAQVYKDLRPVIAKKVLDSESKWDDWAFKAVDGLVSKFLDDQVLASEKPAEEMIEEAKALA